MDLVLIVGYMLQAERLVNMPGWKIKSGKDCILIAKPVGASDMVLQLVLP